MRLKVVRKIKNSAENLTFQSMIFSTLFTDVKRSIELLDKLQKSMYSHVRFNLFVSQENHSIITVVFAGGEIPATKLAALQKVLQSDFLNAIREVYEHIYDTVDVQVWAAMHFYSFTNY